MRALALWFPDWPLQAAAVGTAGPVAIHAAHRVVACSAAARRLGVRRGMALRVARGLAPDLKLLPRDPQRDARAFEPIAAGLDEVVAAVEVARPGLLLIDAHAAAHYYRSEARATEIILDAVAPHECFAGIADTIPTAEIAARAGGVTVAPGESRAFLARQPLSTLVEEEALGCEAATVEKLAHLGLRTLGQLAELPASAVTSRFGAAGRRCHAIASGADPRPLTSAPTPADLAAEVRPDEPIERVDAAAFAARGLAAAVHAKLADAGLVCVRLAITAETSGGEELTRVWHTPRPLTERETADRVRWQLDGWLTAGGSGALVGLRIAPLDVEKPGFARGLWGTAAEHDEQAISRIEALLGGEAVLRPRPAVGRWQGEGEGPLPSRVAHPASRVVLVDEASRSVVLTAELTLRGVPYAMAWGTQRYLVVAWTMPWAVGRRLAKIQIVAGGRAWLLLWTRQQWRVESYY